MKSGLVALLLVAGVALLAWLMRRSSSGVETTALPAHAPHEEPEYEEDGDETEIAVTSDGDVFLPDGRTVRILALQGGDEDGIRQEDIEAGLLAMGPAGRRHLKHGAGQMGIVLQAGDLTGARIRRDAAGGTPWRLETLGRDGDYGFFPFETEDGARAALALVENLGIVRRPLGDDDRPIPAAAGDFEEARRRYDQTLQELALESDPGEGPGAPYSNRR